MSKKLLIFLLLISLKSFAQLPPNIGFEDGSFNHWNCAAGKIIGDESKGTSSISVQPCSPIIDRHTIFEKEASAKIFDPYGNFPVVCPTGGDYSVRLGNDKAGAEAESLSYTFFVPAALTTSYAITFSYAVVLQNPPHQAFEQPRFTARVYDVSDDRYAECPSFDFVAGSALPGFKKAGQNLIDSDGLAAPVFYKDWSNATIDLTQYAGKLMRIEFTTNDCSFNKHFGYAYIDIEQGKLSSQPITGNAYCEGESSITLKGPIGFQSYIWYDKNMTTELGAGKDLEIFPPPPDLTEYTLKVIPYPELGCEDLLHTVVNKINTGFVMNVKPSITGCPETGVDITTPDITAGSSPGLVYTYYNDASESTFVRDPKNIVLPGTYFIKGLNDDGCSNTKTINVVLTAPVITVTQPDPVTYPATVDITKSFVPQPGNTYGFYKDASATIPLTGYTAIDHTGSYFIKVTSDFGCDLITPVDVKILPPPPYIVKAPNVFTPNNDGVNDFFSLHIEGFVQFNSISIYNRYGQLMYNTKSQADLWDGKFNGQQLPIGTYYWIFEGLDTYYHAPITKSGAIAIIR